MKRIITFMLLATLSWAVTGQNWKKYPYQPEGSLIAFPEDEGAHPQEPSEWWYTVAHVTGDSTGTEYTFMLTYFRHPQFGFDGFRIFNLSNENTKVFYPETMPCDYSVMAVDSVDIEALPFGYQEEYWRNQLDTSGCKIPFRYYLSAHQQHGFIEMKYDAFKPPLILGDSGFLYEGAESYTYYYSQTGLHVEGTLSLDGITETVSGTAWIDRQYGAFNSGGEEQYEWFCLQLSDGTDINMWNIFNAENRIPDTSTYRIISILHNDTTSETGSQFDLERLQYRFMPDSERCYSQKWHLAYEDIDLTITVVNPNSEVLLPFRFFEGNTSVTGTVAGENVTGKGFAELVHSYRPPRLDFTVPGDTTFWNTGQPLSWKVLNPDDGNPLHYSISYATLQDTTFTTIATQLTDTAFLWDAAGLPDSTRCYFKTEAFSIDSTLKGTAFSDTVMILKTGIAAFGNNNSLIVFPNPSSGRFLVSGCKISELTIINAEGATVYRQKKPGNDYVTINLQGKKGVFLIKAKTEKGIITKRVIVE